MILFETVDATFVLRHKIAIKNWIKEIIFSSNSKVGDINYIFASDQYVLDVNRQFLGHDYFTDIITFDTSGYGAMHSAKRQISADIFISLDTVKRNAEEYSATFTNELYRVMAHGVLHLTGYDDRTDCQIKKMRAAEESALSLLPEILKRTDQVY